MFYIIGLLFGKVLLMNMIASLPLNTAFFRMLLGETISVQDVDPALARALAKPEGLIGLDFTYPGIPGLELVKNGAKKEVTAQNLKEYVNLVRKKTVELPAILEQFRRAFSTVVQWEFLSLFDAKEIAILFTGEPVMIKEEDLRKYVRVSHGYNPGCVEVERLFEVILEMTPKEQGLLVKFITGADRLPAGGLKALRPELTIAKRTPQEGQTADETLPSVMTCANYFKVPNYSCKEVMKEKILLAISEGQESFLLT
jgi:E3 ubiquitin-protein ligase TRIP12